NDVVVGGFENYLDFLGIKGFYNRMMFNISFKTSGFMVNGYFCLTDFWLELLHIFPFLPFFIKCINGKVYIFALLGNMVQCKCMDVFFFFSKIDNQICFFI